jgi:transketolase
MAPAGDVALTGRRSASILCKVSRLSADLVRRSLKLETLRAKPDPVSELRRRAKDIRRSVVRMAAGKGEGYVGQGLDVADILAVLFGSEMHYDPVDRSDGTDRLIFSTGHYSIGLWAALADAGHLDGHDLNSYAADGSTLIMSTHEGHPPLIELTGGSLGHGLGVASGLALGYRIKGFSRSRIFNFMTDGELQEGSTWESAMFAADRRLGNLVCVVDVNRTQADGDLVLEIEPHGPKWSAFGWWVDEVDGNDVAALLDAFDRARVVTDRPKAVICRTTLGCGVPLIMERERSHFVRVDQNEWDAVARQLEEFG